MDHSKFSLLLACYRSGQMSERQWQAHLEDKGFSGWFHVLREEFMTDDSPLNDKMRKAADGALLVLVARLSMVLVVPIGGGIWVTMDKTRESTIRLEEKVSNLIDRQLPEINTRFDSRFNAQAARLDDNARRIGKLEDWRNGMPSRSSP